MSGAKGAVLSNRKLKSLRLAGSSPKWEWCMVALEDRQLAAIPLLKRKGGVLLALPQSSFTQEELEAGQVGTELPDLGPSTLREVAVADDVEATAAVVYLDFHDKVFSKVRVMGSTPRWPEGVVKFTSLDGDEVLPCVDELLGGAHEWVGDGEARASEQYVTAAEDSELPSAAPLPPPVLDAVLLQLQQLSEAVNGLQADMGQVKQQAASSTAPPAEVPTPALGTQRDGMGALQQVELLAGRPPVTKAKITRQELTTTQVPALEDEAGEEDEVGVHMDTDQLLRLALVKMMSKNAKNTRRRKVGLSLEESSGSEAEDDPLRKLSGAKGTLLQERLKTAMQSHPKDYVNAVENLAAAALGQSAAGDDTMERYVREELPVGGDRNLGHCTWLMLKAANLLKAKQADSAHLLLLLGLAAIEQYKLDQNWTAAWRMTQLPLPPFQEWRVRESTLSQLRHDHAHSRLVHATWAAAITARLKDEEVLVRRRGQYRAPANSAVPKANAQKGKGRGKGNDHEETQQ